MHGIDHSKAMLAAANCRVKNASSDIAARATLQPGRYRKARLSGRFDVVIALFHVISYHPTNKDLTRVRQARFHFNPGGTFFFDCWYGPAVLTEKPTVRIKRMEDDETRVVRIAEPVMVPNENRVDVNYQVFVMNRIGSQFEVLQESHRMRYLFLPEIELLLADSGLKLIDCFEWMTGRSPSSETWGVCCTCKVI